MARGNIFLVGMMGAGKTTLGRALAQRLRLRFVDTDKVLVDRTGVPVATTSPPASPPSGPRSTSSSSMPTATPRRMRASAMR